MYYLNAQDQIVSAEDFDAEDDAAAIAEAEARCAAHPVCDAVELWQGPRRVHYHRLP